VFGLSLNIRVGEIFGRLKLRRGMMNSRTQIVVLLSLVFLTPTITQAQLNWTSHEYFVTASGSWRDASNNSYAQDYNNDSLYTQLAGTLSTSVNLQNPFDIQSANAAAEITNTGIDSFTMYTGLYAEEYAPFFTGSGSRAYATNSALYSGSYLATENTLKFDFELEYALSAIGDSVSSTAEHEIHFMFDVYDGEESLFSEEFFFDIAAVGIAIETEGDLAAETWFVNVTAGHEISMIISLDEYSQAKLSSNAGHNSVTLDYTLTEVPEPASLTILLVGGAVLRLRKFRLKK
jgi:hypothetical protein